MTLHRREFLKRGAGLVTAGMVVPAFLAETARLLDGGSIIAQASALLARLVT